MTNIQKKKKKKKKLNHLANNRFSIGENIFHNDYGVGKILGINGKKLQIKFNNYPEMISIFSDYVKKK